MANKAEGYSYSEGALKALFTAEEIGCSEDDGYIGTTSLVAAFARHRLLGSIHPSLSSIHPEVVTLELGLRKDAGAKIEPCEHKNHQIGLGSILTKAKQLAETRRSRVVTSADFLGAVLREEDTAGIVLNRFVEQANHQDKCPRSCSVSQRLLIIQNPQIS